MTTATATSKPARTRKPVARHCRVSAAVNGCFAVELTVGKSRTAYYMEPLASDFGRAFRLTKFGATPGTDEAASAYEVCLDSPGSDCGCKGYLRHGRCKHVEGLLALVAAGKL
jgi:hypothetical protein